ncbi:amino acid transporter [Ascobolus immersus RN42]|uniref:Amino acid transporter n=1 Tax=Ascobolus immersus RN42 TaxID=1160509 RepID=A0A3N4HGZ0_ASCIM|nr:amino acid transporter [Ascobolus immersus RN42]
MKWWHAGLVMIAETVSLGILSLPKVLSEVGLIPGVILIIGLSAIATYTGYIIGQFKQRYPQTHSMADAGWIIGGPKYGRIVKEICGVGQLGFLIFCMSAHVLSFAIMLNVLTDHKMCTIWFMFIGMIVSLICTIPRTLKHMAFLAIASFLSVIGAVMVTMVGVGTRNQPTGPVEMVRKESFIPAFNAVTNICFAYAGHLTFFTFISEMKNPKDFPKALALLQISDTALYVLSAIVIYCFTGYGVASPALRSAGVTLGKVAYGLASATIIISGVVNAHVAAKYIIVRMYRNEANTDNLNIKTKKSWMVWLGLITGLWIIAWLIAEAIPVFNNLLSLTAALFVSWFTFGLNALFWFHLNWDVKFKGKKNIWLTCVNAFIIFVGLVVMFVGTYTSIHGIIHEAASQVFSCADNSL